MTIREYTFTGTDTDTTPIAVSGTFAIELDFSGGAGTVAFESRPQADPNAVYTRASETYTASDVKLGELGDSISEVRLVCTAYTSGTITARIY